MNDRTVERSRPEQAGSDDHHIEGLMSSNIDTTDRAGNSAAVTA